MKRSEKSAGAVVAGDCSGEGPNEKDSHETCCLARPCIRSPGNRGGVRGQAAVKPCVMKPSRRDVHKRTAGPDLLEQVLARENMARAWKRVKANKGSAGVDGRTVQDTGDALKSAWPDIRKARLDGSYRPSAVRRVGIPKPGGGVRELGIPTVVDRLIQQALLQVLHLRIDPTFSAHSGDFRPGRSTHGAVLEAQRYVQAGYRVVVDVDLEKILRCVGASETSTQAVCVL